MCSIIDDPRAAAYDKSVTRLSQIAAKCRNIKADVERFRISLTLGAPVTMIGKSWIN
jgi:hypothetical protein